MPISCQQGKARWSAMNKQYDDEFRDDAEDASDESSQSVPTAGAAEDIGKTSQKDSARLRRLADSLFFRAFTQDREK